jgi:hypothetical protein
MAHILRQSNQIHQQMKKSIIIIIILIGLVSCGKTPKYDYQVVDSDIVIKMREELGNPNRSFKLNLLTEKGYPCMNYPLITNSDASSNKIIVDILGIYIQDMCLTAFGPATATIPLSNIQNKSYDIEFKIGSNISTGKLICTSDEFKLQMNELLQIKIDDPVLKRIPNNTIWGTIGYHSSTSIDKVNDFINSIKAAGATDVNLQNGNFNYFEIENFIIKEPTNKGYHFTKSFVYSFTGDKNLVRSIVKDYGKNFGDIMSVSVYGDMGEEFLGWILKNE